MKKFGFAVIVLVVSSLFIAFPLPSSPSMEELEGTLEVIMATKISEKTCQPLYFVVNASGKKTQFSLPARAPLLSPGQKIKISGRWDENAGKKSFRCRKVAAVANATALAKKMASTGSTGDYLPKQTPVLGEQRTLVVLIAFPDHTIPEWGKEKAENKVFSSEPTNEYPNDHSDNAYWKECSNEKMWLTGECLDGWKEMPKPTTDYGYASNDELGYFSSLVIDALTLIDPYVDFTQYDRVIFLRSGKLWGYAFASIGKQTFSTDDGEVELSYAFVGEHDVELRRDYISHELGHGLGFVHANGKDVTTNKIYTYGDVWDNRGQSFAQTDSLHKYMRGWLEVDQIKIITSSDTVWLEQRELDSDGIKLILVPLGFTYENGVREPILFYYEYFKELGEFDSRVFYDFEPDINKDVVLPRKYESENTYDSLVYANIDTSGVKALDIESQEFCDSEYGICVQVLQKTGTGANAQAEVRITIPTPTPTPSPTPSPTLTPTPSPKPTPTPSPTPSPSPTPTPTPMTVKEIQLSSEKIKVKVEQEADEVVTLICDQGKMVSGELITATVIKGKKNVSVSPASATSNENGQAVFKIKGLKKGKAQVFFTVQNVKKVLRVKVK